jgi:AhpD family alkylhydroperoxidase
VYNKTNLGRLKKMDSLAPEVMKAFWAFDKAAVGDGAIPVKYKELIAVAVALTTQCPYCIDVHAGNARKAGVSDTELVEAAMVAAALRAGAAAAHATHALSDCISGLDTLGLKAAPFDASSGVNDKPEELICPITQ